MVCANIFLTVAALITFFFGVWPPIGGETLQMWMLVISSVATLILAWTMVDCKACKNKTGDAAAPIEAPAKEESKEVAK